VVDQVNTAFESAAQNLRKPMSDLKFALTVFIFVLVGLQLVLTPVSAINDIKASPNI
jgi:NhaP-type Na+/H+ or K+/H+ antiporter